MLAPPDCKDRGRPASCADDRVRDAYGLVEVVPLLQRVLLVLHDEQRLARENEEYPLQRWDYFHKPVGVSHTIVGAGGGPSAILAIGGREHQKGPDWGGYPYSEAAMKHNASAEEETTDPDVAYARFPDRQDGEFREEWLP